MIVKKNEKPNILLQLEALTRRLTKDHPKQNYIQSSLAKRRAGFNGENSLDYYLDYLKGEKHHIFHDLRLHDGVHHFQIDLLILTKNFILIVEVKNISGILYFDSTFNQLIRYQDDKEESFPDPILQVSRHKEQITTWLTSHKFPRIPIETLVLISKPSTIIKVLGNQNQISQTVIHGGSLLRRMAAIEQKYNREILSDKELKKLSRQLLKRHENFYSNILEQFEISPDEIKTGVFCLKCAYLPLKRIYGSWYCPVCKNTTKDDHLQALREYVLLVRPRITKQEMAAFLHIESLATVKRLITLMNLQTEGKTKSRTYNLSNL